MKTKILFSILFLIGLVAGAVADKPEVSIISGIGFCIAVSSTKRSDLAYVQLVPAKVFDNQGQEVPPITRAQKAIYDFLRMKANDLTRESLRAGDLVYDPITYYIRFDITGLSGRQKIVSTSTIKSIGVTNFDKGILPQWYNFAFDKIVVRYANAISASASPASTAAYSSLRSSMPAALANSELIVSVNQNIIIQTPSMDFMSAAAITGGGVRDFDGGDLQDPKIFPENLNIEVELNLATGQTMPSAANNTYLVEVAFEGVQARLR